MRSPKELPPSKNPQQQKAEAQAIKLLYHNLLTKEPYDALLLLEIDEVMGGVDKVTGEGYFDKLKVEFPNKSRQVAAWLKSLNEKELDQIDEGNFEVVLKAPKDIQVYCRAYLEVSYEIALEEDSKAAASPASPRGGESAKSAAAANPASGVSPRGAAAALPTAADRKK